MYLFFYTLHRVRDEKKKRSSRSGGVVGSELRVLVSMNLRLVPPLDAYYNHGFILSFDRSRSSLIITILSYLVELTHVTIVLFALSVCRSLKRTTSLVPATTILTLSSIPNPLYTPWSRRRIHRALRNWDGRICACPLCTASHGRIGSKCHTNH